MHTALFYLSGKPDLVGGETVFYKGTSANKIATEVPPAVGLALFHGHGTSHCLLHEARPVVKGVKYVLRTDILYA